MGTKLFALLTDGKDVESLAGALLDAATWHLLCYGEKPEISAAGSPRFPFESVCAVYRTSPGGRHKAGLSNIDAGNTPLVDH